MRASFLATSCLSALTVLGASLPLVAIAQEAPEASDEVITVTATRRAVSVQDVPLNISAVGAAQIEEQGFRELSDFLAFIPGINVVDQGPRSGNAIVARGLNADPIGAEEGLGNGGGGTVATYLGEIPIYIDLKLNDISRVEVLLGPQGTLYGAGTLGGAIRYIPNRPDFARNLFEVRAEASQYSEADDLSSDLGFTANYAFSDVFAIRGSLDYLNDTGFIDYPFLVRQIGVSDPDPDFTNPAAVAANLRRADDVNGEEALSGRVAARFAPSPLFDATLTYYFQNQDIEGRTVSSRRSTVPAGEYEAGLRVLEPNRRDNELLALEITSDLGFAELTSATGFGRYAEQGSRDQTDLLITLEYSYEAFPTFAAFTREDQENEFLNQELRLVSTADTWYNWIVGAYYNRFEGVASSSEFTPGYAAFAGFNRPDDLEYFSTDRSQLTETAFFGEVGFDVTDRWNVIFGARYYDYDLKTVSTVDFPLFDPSFVAQTLDQIRDNAFDPNTGQADNGFLYKFNSSYQVTDDILGYLTISQGYRIGNSNGLGPCPAFDPNATQGACALAPGQQFGPNPGDLAQFDERQYSPDQTLNYEIGAKTSWLDGRLVVNGALYFIEWEDPQVSSATVNANIPITINASGAQSRGLDLAVTWLATENLLLRSSYSFVSTELTDDVPFLVRTITPPGFGTAFEDGRSGDRLPGSPEHQFSVFAGYTQPLQNGDRIAYNASLAYQGDVLTRTGGRGSSVTLDSYTLANASVSYEAARWSATAFANNLFDEYIETGFRGTPLSNQTINGANVRSFYANVAPPRRIGVRVKYKFH